MTKQQTITPDTANPVILHMPSQPFLSNWPQPPPKRKIGPAPRTQPAKI